MVTRHGRCLVPPILVYIYNGARKAKRRERRAEPSSIAGEGGVANDGVIKNN